MELYTAVANIPHPDKADRGGEDGFFLTTPQLSAVGIADGVGGWANSGINPKDFADDLMAFTKEQIELGITNPVVALDNSYLKVCQTGSSTAVVGIMNKKGIFSVANMGDSGFMIIRQNEIIFKSEEQQHGFNFPYQLGKTEGRDGKYYPHGDDRPKDAETYKIKLHKDDIVILGSDGLFDNCWDADILNKVNTLSGESPEILSLELAKLSYSEAGKTDNWVPFGDRALRDGVIKSKNEWRGGKMDDITVIVGIVV